jgi:signal transduction histidine kinase
MFNIKQKRESILKKIFKKDVDFLKSIDTITTKLLMLVLFSVIIPLMVIGNYSSNIISNNIQKSIQRELITAVKLFDEKISKESNLTNKNLNKIITSISNITGLNVQIRSNSDNNFCGTADQSYQTWICRSVKNISDNKTYFVRIAIPEDAFVNPFYKNFSIISILSVISLFIAVGIAAFFARTIITPLLKLVHAAKQISTGNLNHKVKTKGNDEIAQLSFAFNQMVKALKNQEQLKDNFVATLTHDLKVPMLAENKTIGFMLKEAYGPVTKEQKEVLKLIQTTNNSSLEMIYTLLDVYRFEQGNIKLEKTNFNIVDLARNAIEQIHSLAQEKAITVGLKFDRDNIIVNADEREIKRVIHNLISNAIINSIQDSNISCHIEIIKENLIYEPKSDQNISTTLLKPLFISNSVIINIEDNGLGIAKDDMQHLFKRFSLGKGRKPSGTGLGLYYSYQVIKEHTGFIWAESIENKGSNFKFTIPLN